MSAPCVFAALLSLLIFRQNSCKRLPESAVCPFEQNSTFTGYRNRNLCYTLVADENGQGLKRHAALRKYCRQHFKQGDLHYFGQVKNLPITLWRPTKPNLNTILNSYKTEKWSSFLCVHAPYKNCIVNTSRICNYDVNFDKCETKLITKIIRKREVPYGEDCSNKTSDLKEMKMCDCEKCKETAWTAWTRYNDASGKTVQTRYRPPKELAHWPCVYDTEICCFEVKWLDKILNHEECVQIKCNQDAKRINNSIACTCPKGTTGLFCEISHEYCTNNECENNATCIKTNSGYKCICDEKHTGKHCEKIKETLGDCFKNKTKKKPSWMQANAFIIAPLCVLAALLIMSVAQRVSRQLDRGKLFADNNEVESPSGDYDFHMKPQGSTWLAMNQDSNEQQKSYTLSESSTTARTDHSYTTKKIGSSLRHGKSEKVECSLHSDEED